MTDTKDNQLQVILKEQGVAPSRAKQLLEAFGVPFTEAGDILKTYKTIKVTDESDTDGMKQARENRLALKATRVEVEHKRKDLKADLLKEGRAIDAVATFVKQVIEPAEEYLQLQEDFAEIKAAERAATKKAERIERLSPLVGDINHYNFEALTDDEFEDLITERKAARKAIEDAKAKEEADRIAKEKADEEARVEQAKENERLKAEAEARDKKDAEEKKAREEAEAKRQAEQAKKDAAAKAEAERIQKEADDKVAAEKAKAEALEQEKRDREAAEAKKKADAEEQERQALLAPDKEKLTSLAQRIQNEFEDTMPAVKSNKAQEVVNHAVAVLKDLQEFINQKAKEL